MRTIEFLALACLPAALSCGGSGPASPTSATTSTGLSRFSGVWTGTVAVTQVGECAFTGGPRPVTMDWTVTDAGPLTINERQSQATWSGTIASDLTVSINRTDTAICSGSFNTSSAAYSGTIRRDGSYRVDLEAIGTPCPPNCTFKYVYSMTKQ